MAHLPLALLGHHYTQQAIVGVAKSAGKYALNQGYKALKNRVSKPVLETVENLKRRADDFQQIDTVPVKRRNVPCEEMDCAYDGYFDKNVAAYVVVPRTWNTAALNVFDPVQGDDIQNRRGRSVLVKKINLRLTFRIESQLWDTGGGLQRTPPSVRYVVYVDKFPNGASSTADQVFLSTGSSNEPVDFFRNVLYTDRFYVLDDRTFTMNPQMYYDSSLPGAMSGQITKVVHIELPCEILARYNAGNAGSVADCIENYIYLAVVSGSNHSLRTGYDVRLYCDSRVTFESLSKY